VVLRFKFEWFNLFCLDLEESDFLTSLRTHHATERDAAHYHASNKSEIVMSVRQCRCRRTFVCSCHASFLFVYSGRAGDGLGGLKLLQNRSYPSPLPNGPDPTLQLVKQLCACVYIDLKPTTDRVPVTLSISRLWTIEKVPLAKFLNYVPRSLSCENLFS